MRAHAEAITIETEKPIPADEARALLEAAKVGEHHGEGGDAARVKKLVDPVRLGRLENDRQRLDLLVRRIILELADVVVRPPGRQPRGIIGALRQYALAGGAPA